MLQGWELADYLEHIEMYRAAGVDLTEIERVGVGSVCRRQSTAEGVEIISTGSMPCWRTCSAWACAASG